MKLTLHEQSFVNNISQWNDEANNRQMPWKGENDPYKIWLSEIILQQTRVNQGLGYYNRFIATFPTIQQLANAPETTVFKLWEGLGYYTRCKNLIATAKYIAFELNGKFPNKYEEILQLKGIGPYTAAAISSFAFNLPYAVLDGNVFRVLARYFGIATAIDSNEGKHFFTLLANNLLDKKQPGKYNQTIMDFGAVICKPQLPDCNMCVLQATCKAYAASRINQLPVKEKKVIKKIRWIYYLVVEYNGKQYVRLRGPKDIWENLYEFVLIENDKALSIEKFEELEIVKTLFDKTPFKVTQVSKLYKQQLTHQTIHGQFISINTTKPFVGIDYKALSPLEISLLPFPKFITTYLKDRNISLNLF